MSGRRVLSGRFWFAALVVAGTMAGEAPAQQSQPRRKRPAVEKTVPPAPAPAAPVPPHQKPLIDLSELMGALAFLTEICTPADSTDAWRRRMETLLAAEGEASGARDRMTGAFNQGYAAYSTSYRQCTPAARAAIEVLTRDAGRLARDIERRFGT